MRQVAELENALNRALSQLTIDVDVGPGVTQLNDDLEDVARTADDAADETARIDRELEQADRSADDLENAFRDVERAADATADETKRIDDEAKKAGTSVGGLGSTLKTLAISAAVAIGLREVGKAALDAISAAVDLSESINAVEVVFGDASQQVLQFGADATDAVFLAASEFNQLAAVTGTLLQGFGLDVQQVADITIVLTERAADLASVFNTEVAVAMEAINAALRGETEQIRRFTGSFSIDEVKAFGRELFNVTGALTSQQQALAAVEFLLVKTDQVQGDAANTADELANRQRALTEQWTNAQAEIGEALVPAMEKLIELMVAAIPLIKLMIGPLSDLVNLFVGRIDELKDFNVEWQAFLDTLPPGVDGMDALRDRIEATFVDGALRATSAVGELVGSIGGLIDEQMASTLAADAEADAFKESALAGAAFAKAQQRLLGDVADTTQGLQDQRQAIIDLAREQAASADPIINLIRRTADHKQALADLAVAEADDKTSVEDLTEARLRVIETGGELTVAEATVLTALDESTEGFINQASAAGLTADAVDTLIASLDRLRSTPVPVIGVGPGDPDFDLRRGRGQDGGGGGGPQAVVNIFHPTDPDIPGNGVQAANMIGALVGATTGFRGR